MVKIPANLAENFKDGSPQQPAPIQQVQVSQSLRRVREDNIVYTQQDSITYLVGTNIDRQSYKYTSNWRRKASTKRLS